MIYVVVFVRRINMDKRLFQQFLRDARLNERVIWDCEESKPYSEILHMIYTDVSKFKYYTFDGRFEDILVKLLKNPKYETEGYKALLNDIESELNKLVVTNIMLLPINFIDNNKFNGDIKLNNYINLFLPTKEDLIKYDDCSLRIKQEKRRKVKKDGTIDNLSKYFEGILENEINKGHILHTKDRNFFNYPILSIMIDNVDYKVEKESGRIAQAVYSILRIIDFREEKEPFSWGILSRDWIEPAKTYVVYYNKENYKSTHRFNDGYYGYSFMFNFSYYLDISTLSIVDNLEKFTNVLDLYIKTCFLDLRKYDSKQLKLINKWNNAISLFNTAYEFASIEKYDGCDLILCALLESLFLENEGRKKLERLRAEISEYTKDIYDDLQRDEFLSALSNVYHFRNKIMHDGIGYEAKYMSSRRINHYQGIYRGMKPFHYSGAVYPDNDILDIKKTLMLVADILIGEKCLNRICGILNKNEMVLAI